MNWGTVDKLLCVSFGQVLRQINTERGVKMGNYCAFYDMDANKVWVWQSDRNTVAIDCTMVENAVADNLYQKSELDYLIWNDPMAYAELVLNGDPVKYLRTITVYRSEELE